jgi:type I restriction enzyme R subunit
VTGITAEMPLSPTRDIAEVVEDIWANKDRDYNLGCLIKRIQRIDKSMSGEGRDAFSKFVADGDLARYARGLHNQLKTDFVGTMKMLRDKEFQELLVNYPRPKKVFLIATEQNDNVSSQSIPKDYEREDYLKAFAAYVRDNETKIEAIRILLSRPVDWSPAALLELKKNLFSHPKFNIGTVQKAYESHYRKALVDIISLVKRAADEQQPIYTAAERVDLAFAAVTSKRTFTPEQTVWLGRIREHMLENLSIDTGDFDLMPVFSNAGGLTVVRRAFGEDEFIKLIHKLNEAIAA